MDRVEKVKELLKLVRQVTTQHQKILSTQRQYFDGEMLYMREAHFVMAIGIGRAPTMTEMAEKLEVTPGAVSQLAKRMEEKGFIKRITSREDRRVNEVVLTEKGEKLYAQHKLYDEVSYQELASLFQDYSEEELDFLMQFEQRLEAAFGDFVKSEKKN